LKRLLLLPLIIMLLTGCNLAGESLLPQPPPEIVAPILTQQAPVGSAVLSDSWQSAAPGMDVRQLVPNGDVFKTLVLTRLDPNVYTFKAHYRPGAPLTLREWQVQLPDADLIINANFFHPDNTVVGMIITDEGAFGETLINRGGMFSIQGGIPVIQSLVQEPYDGRWLDHAVQGFPSLMIGGAASQINPNENRASRRTSIAMDAQGRVVIISTPLLGMGLYDISQYLAASDLQLMNVVNLDGGGSTMLEIGPINYQILSFDPVPAVLAAYKK
jgi:hypothetical protein